MVSKFHMYFLSSFKEIMLSHLYVFLGDLSPLQHFSFLSSENVLYAPIIFQTLRWVSRTMPYRVNILVKEKDKQVVLGQECCKGDVHWAMTAHGRVSTTDPGFRGKLGSEAWLWTGRQVRIGWDQVFQEKGLECVQAWRFERAWANLKGFYSDLNPSAKCFFFRMSRKSLLKKNFYSLL